MSLYSNIGIKYVVPFHISIGYCFNSWYLLDSHFNSSSLLCQTIAYTTFYMDSAYSSMSFYLHLIYCATTFEASFLYVNKHILYSTLQLRHVFSTHQTETWPQRVGVSLWSYIPRFTCAPRSFEVKGRRYTQNVLVSIRLTCQQGFELHCCGFQYGPVWAGKQICYQYQ